MIGQGWQTLRVALEDIGGLLRDLVPWPRRRRLPEVDAALQYAAALKPVSAACARANRLEIEARKVVAA